MKWTILFGWMSVTLACHGVNAADRSADHTASAGVTSTSKFVRPGHGIPSERPIWGHKDGLRIGLHPTPGPAGLIRIYAPYLDQEFPRVVNFISVEPTVRGQRGRDQSELQMSRDRPGERGLSFWATNEKTTVRRPGQPVSGSLSDDESTLQLFIHTEPFQNGSRPIIECIFHAAQPHEFEMVLHAAPDSAPMTYCTLSATMGNFGQLRRIHLRDGRIVSARNLWSAEDPLDRLGFLRWHTWTADQLERTPDGRYFVELSTDAPDPASVEHAPDVARHWRYVGKKASHYWRASSDVQPIAAVNGRRTYWMSQSAIPGGTAFENFELRVPFRPGMRLWFGVEPD